MSGKHHPSAPENEQVLKLYPPVDDDGWHTSQVRDWVGVSPELSDAAIRLYLILRALVIEKRGPVRKLTLWELCHLMPARGKKTGGAPSSISRIRNLLRELAAIGLITTPDGRKFGTSSRALASGRGMSMRINLMPVKTYKGPRNVFDVLDDIREAKAAEESARRARQRELELAEEKRAKRAQERAGQISDPHSGADLQDREPPHSPPAQTDRADKMGPPVRPSVQVEDAPACETDGRTDASSTGDVEAGTAADGRGADGGDDDHRAGHVQTTPGMDVIRAVGNLQPKLRLTGKVKTDQARRLNELIAASEAAGDTWTQQQLIDELAVPLTEPIRKTPGAVISRRISLLPLTPHTAAGMLPGQATGEQHGAGPVVRERSSSLAADRPVVESVGRRVRGECPECGADSPGDVVCGACLGWPECEAGCGYRVERGGVCPTCEQRAFHAEIEAPPTDDGTCPGFNEPCGKAVVNLGYCGRCRILAENARDEADARWRESVTAAAAAVAAEHGQQGAQAPF